MIRLAVVQHACDWRTDNNLQTSLDSIEQAASMAADIVLLPELSCYPYFCITENTQYFRFAETIPGPMTQALSDAARKHKLIIITTLFEKRTSGIYHNTAVVIDTYGDIAGQYRKMHIPDDPGFHEKFYFTPGDQGFVPIDTTIARLGVLVCWDQWYPEAARLMALNGAELFLIPSAIGWDVHDDKEEQDRQRDAWITVQKGHAIANVLPLAVSNRIGTETNPEDSSLQTRFWGSGFITGQQGERLAQASTDRHEIICADIDLDKTEAIRQIWPFFRDRRIDHYQDLLKRFNNN